MSEGNGKTVQFTLDGAPVTVAAGDTLLDACRCSGAREVPTLCHDS